MEFDTHHSSGHGYKGTAIRLRQDQHDRDQRSCHNIHRYSDQGSSKLQDAIPLPHELGDHGVHHQVGSVPRRIYNEWGTHWHMPVEEDHPTHVRRHHGYCITRLRDPDGYASEATHLPTQHWEIQRVDSHQSGEVGIQRTRGQRLAHIPVELIPGGS